MIQQQTRHGTASDKSAARLRWLTLATLLSAACETSTTVHASAVLSGPVDPACLVGVAAGSLGTGAARPGHPYPFAANLAAPEGKNVQADVRVISDAAGADRLEVSVAWWGTVDRAVVTRTERNAVLLLRQMLEACAPRHGEGLDVACNRSVGRHTESGCL